MIKNGLYAKIVKFPESEKDDLRILAIKRGYDNVMAFVVAIVSKEVTIAKKQKEI